jgi:cyanophycinase-like exopeptidase
VRRVQRIHRRQNFVEVEVIEGRARHDALKSHRRRQIPIARTRVAFWAEGASSRCRCISSIDSDIDRDLDQRHRWRLNCKSCRIGV